MVLLVQNYLLNKEIDLKETEVISARSPEINFEQYREIFNYMVDNLKIDGYYLMGGDTIPGIIIIEKDLTFNKRSVLNLSDKLNVVDESTQKTLVFKIQKTQNKYQLHLLSWTLIWIVKEAFFIEMTKICNEISEKRSAK